MQADEFAPFVPPVDVTTPNAKRVAATSGTPARPKRKPRPSNPVAMKKPAKPAIPPAPRHVRPKRKNTARKKVAKKLNKAFETTRKAITQNLYGDKKVRKARVQKVDLDTALQIGAMLKATDLNVFGELRQLLQSANKATRKRVLAAVTKVFG